MEIVTCIAPINIAVIKYWGKKCEEKIIPVNDSLSATLALEQMCAKTTIMASPNFKENKIWLNGKEESFENYRLQNCLTEIRNRVRNEENDSKQILSWKIHICSENNFPTAAGLASSAAGYACLVYSLSQLYSIRGDISTIARQGSGSACRSTLGGWVRWHAGVKDDGSDSIAKEVAPADHWPEMRILVLVVNETQKKCPSSIGMKNSVLTSQLLKYRAEKCVPERIQQMSQAILEKDFTTFAKLTIQDSNQFHAVCLDTNPPCFYMNDTSRDIVELVHCFNEVSGSLKVAYTFDAGPNACLYLLEETVPIFLSVLNKIFPPNDNDIDYVKGIPIDIPSSVPEFIKSIPIKPKTNGLLKYIIYTKVGDGPRLLNDPNEHLLDENGLPK
ncbi:diphosphomevalonate decarboxylase isoform X2 [Chrysoperla carnea]|uniref:diphosphomevalonate decarboxylase isoform X2 n=1 Tax=Chrysoperla carnea TaxID=189513 RepID=UPI001D092E22|nr:diphosphomevalonate decarboxylase isoform X2 [Chrysoperla carnea]